MQATSGPFGSRRHFTTSQGEFAYYSLDALEEAGLIKVSELPFTIRVLLENALRNLDGGPATEDHVRLVASWRPDNRPETEFPYMPGRVVLQDFTGVPVVVDLAAMRDAVEHAGGNASIINPIVRSDLVIDHSVQVDFFNSAGALAMNIEREFERNTERYLLLKWAQSAFSNLRVVPPGTGIVHQVNLEYLAPVVLTDPDGDTAVVYPDTCIGTDSHTTMINGLGVLGWGVGGIEAEAVMLGQPYYMLVPEVVGVRLTGSLPEGATATDLVLSITELLRKVGVVEKFVEFYGPGLDNLPVADRATIGNMSPEYGATCGFFPTDNQTLKYLRDTGRDDSQVELVEAYTRANHLFRASGDEPQYSTAVEFDLGSCEPSLAGPKRPQDRVPLTQVESNFHSYYPNGAGDDVASERSEGPVTDRQVDGPIVIDIDGQRTEVGDGSVVIAAITSCTNTSNPSVMLGAGLVARKAREKGLTRKPWVKTSMAPGSTVVTRYLEAAGLDDDLDAIGFQTVGYGCTTCIGNSGPLPQPVADAINDHDLVAVAVLSGNRNFEGRVHPQVKANYLASPMLVVAYALAGRIDMDLVNEPLGIGSDGKPVHLRDVWPTQSEIAETVAKSLTATMFREQYSQVFTGPEKWRELSAPTTESYAWDPGSTYIQKPPYFDGFTQEPKLRGAIAGARVLVVVGDSVTTDHISPAGSIPPSAPSGQFLVSNDVPRREFNSYGARRGNHHVMMRGTFGNIRLRNLLTPQHEGDWTTHLPDGEVMRIFDAFEKYRDEGTPLLVLAGKEYGTGSSRDWAAKGTALLGVRAVIAESFERIHRSNLIGMGVLPLQYLPGESADTAGLTGKEEFDIPGVGESVQPGQLVAVVARADDGSTKTFRVKARVDSGIEAEYYRHGGLLPYVLRQMMAV